MLTKSLKKYLLCAVAAFSVMTTGLTLATEKPSSQAIKAAVKGYHLAEKKGLVQNKNIVTIVDFSKGSNQERLFIYDIKKKKVLYRTLVSHGKGSGTGAMATQFSNQPQSRASSLGVYVTKGTYPSNKGGKGIRLQGLQKGYNDNALSRAIVFHQAAYVSPSIAKNTHRVGNSWGCFALEPQAMKTVASKIGQGSVVVAYHQSLKI